MVGRIYKEDQYTLLHTKYESSWPCGFGEEDLYITISILYHFECFTASKGSNLNILFAITAAGVVPCGGPKKAPRTSSIVQIIFLFRSFEISQGILSVQNTHV